MRPPELIYTSRLLLRPPIADDDKIIFQSYSQDPDVTKYLTWKPHDKIETTTAFVDRCIRCWENETAYPWVIIGKGGGELMGMIELRIDDFRADIGYVLAKQFWGNGFAPEAARAIIDWTLQQEGIYRVWAVCDLDNITSARVMEKVGMEKEGILHRFILHPNICDEPRDCCCYAITK